jgi:hypothetical protein
MRNDMDKALETLHKIMKGQRGGCLDGILTKVRMMHTHHATTQYFRLTVHHTQASRPRGLLPTPDISTSIDSTLSLCCHTPAGSPRPPGSSQSRG